MKRLGVLLLLLDGMLVHRRLPPCILSGFPDSCRYPFILLGGERHCESKVSCPRTQHNRLARARTRTFRSGVRRTYHWATASPTNKSAENYLLPLLLFDDVYLFKSELFPVRTNHSSDVKINLSFVFNLFVNKGSKVFQHFWQIRIHKGGIVTWKTEQTTPVSDSHE